MSTSVTFDSNVWEIIVDEEKRNNSDSIYAKLYELINNSSIQPYFFEGLATMETIRKTDRKEHYANYKAWFSMSVDGELVSSHNGSGGPEISEYLNRVVPQALELGFRFTHLPRIGAPKLDIPEKYWAPDEKFSMKERQDRSFECAQYIESLGAGKGKLMNELGASNGGLVQKTKNDNSVTDNKYSKAVGEWTDGDALAANYGYGIDYFCTNDRASGAGSSSVFHATNLQQLEQRFPVNVVSPEELVQVLGATSA
ncbi:MAG: hypothetical protein RAP03_16785 [Candidatus Electryonea clarkiae]|nr:hypothetical protein [Candidatus Electryonea clarkiae]